jgi:hypothetical protein
MQRARPLAILLLVGAFAALAPVPALAKPATNPIVQACEHDDYTLPGHYSISALQQAYNSIPLAVREYSPCPQVIVDKINQEEQGKTLTGTKAGSGGGFPVLPVLIAVILIAGGAGTFYSYRRSRQPPADG